ncbi:hypothetical protein Ndes2526B_g07535 [Nannochloris sp. 'desiccata']|nr:hypothetical protein KSW81_001211 [Chlorella desiccata (nom. nud.)]KAH7617672.1 putative Proline dehydrogenase 1, mitochondrial [Chlorella desiccata (nom. nud.)]
MLRFTARELVRREEWLVKLTTSRQCPCLPLPTQCAAFSTSTATAVDPAHVEDPPITPVEKPVPLPSSLDFNSPWEAYRAKTNSEIVRSILVFRACQFPWLVNNADTILSKSKSIFGSTLVNWVLKHTFYKQFVAGPDAAGIQPTLRRLRQAGVGAVLDYAAEDDVEAEEGPASRQPPIDTVISRTYKYEDEEACDRRMENFLLSIDAARSPDEHSSSGYTAIKVTALGMPRLLERVSTALLAVRSLFSQLDENGDGFLEPEEFSRVYSRLFVDSDEARMNEVFDYLDTDRDGKVDYVAFTKGVTIYDGAEIGARCREQGPFSRAALTKEELQLLDNMVKRVNTLAEAAASSGVRLLVDAEHSYFQPAIDAVVAQLQREHNKDEPRIYNTYQCYLKDVHDRITVDIERANREGYKFGCKLVRGAYMVLERRRATELKLPSPIWETKEETDAAYDAAVAALLPSVRDNGAEIMVATHNQQSVEQTVAGMAALGLPPSSGVTFGQLLGMADHLTFTLGAHKYGAYKYTPFGGVDEVMPYLLRRAQENSDVLGGVGIELGHLQNELKRRVSGA